MSQFKAHISFVLALTLIIGTLWQTYTVVHFYMNRDAITEAYCVNKDQPSLNCKGQCHLKKQLEASTPDQEETQQTGTTKTSILLFVFAKTDEEVNFDNAFVDQKHYPYELIATNHFVSQIYHPPKIS